MAGLSLAACPKQRRSLFTSSSSTTISAETALGKELWVVEASSKQAREELVRGFPPTELAYEPNVVLFADQGGRIVLFREGSEPIEVDLPLERGEGLVRYRLARIQGRALLLQGFSTHLSPSLWWMDADDYLKGKPPSHLFLLSGGFYFPQGIDHPARLEPQLGRRELDFYLGEMSRLADWEKPPVVTLAQISGETVWAGYLSLGLPGLEPLSDLFHPTYLGLEGEVEGLLWYPLPRTNLSELDLSGFDRIWVEPLPGSGLDKRRGVILSSSHYEAVARIKPLIRAGNWLVLLHQTFDGRELVTFHDLSSADPNGSGRFEFELSTSLLSHPITGYPSLSHRNHRLIVLSANDLGGGKERKGDLVLLTLLTPVKERSGETSPPELLVVLLPAQGGKIEVSRYQLPTKILPLLLEPKSPLDSSAGFLVVGWQDDRLVAEELTLLVGAGGVPKGLTITLGPTMPLPNFRLIVRGASKLALKLGERGKEMLGASLVELASSEGEIVGLEKVDPLAEGHGMIPLPLLSRIAETAKLVGDTKLGELVPWLWEGSDAVLTLLERRYYQPVGGSGRLLVAEPPAKSSQLVSGQNFLLLDEEGKVVAGDPTQPNIPQFYSTYPLVLTDRGRAFWLDEEGRITEIGVERYQPQNLIELEPSQGSG